jgi:RNA polymerase sigma-70 factor (ECF subfamily)
VTDARNNPTLAENTADPARDARAALVERLFREHNQALLRFLVSKLQSQQEAKDIAQEAYVRLLKLDTPDAVSYLRAFLFKTASNLAIDRLRTRQAETRRLEMEFFEEQPFEPDPENRVTAAEDLRVIEQSLRKLPPKCRQAFLLRRLDGLSCAEIARRMQIPERTVRHYITEAIVYCRSRLERNAAVEE